MGSTPNKDGVVPQDKDGVIPRYKDGVVPRYKRGGLYLFAPTVVPLYEQKSLKENVTEDKLWCSVNTNVDIWIYLVKP